MVRTFIHIYCQLAGGFGMVSKQQLELTIAQFAKFFDMSERTARNWAKSGKLKTTKRLINNRDTTIVFVNPNNLPEGLIWPEGPANENDIEEEFPAILPEGVKPNVDNDYLALIKKMYEDHQQNYMEIKQYAELAGQAKLLTDSEHSTKQELFEIKQENKTLIIQKAKLEEKIQLLEKQLDEYKEKVFKLEETLQKKLESEPEKTESFWTRKL